jgi:hypothetical protein
MTAAQSDRKLKGRVRDPIYENDTGRPASAEAVKLRKWVHQRYQDDPETLPGRFRYYEAIMAEVIDKHAAQTVESVAAGVTVTKGDVLWKAALMWVRENGLVPDSWVEDRTRRLYDYTGWESVEEGVLAQLDQVPLDAWKGKPPLLVVESEASASALDGLARQYRIPLAPLRGQAGRAYLANVVAPTIYEKQIVLAVVDLDKVGDDIANSAWGRLERFSGHRLDWRVIALTDEQADDPDYNIVRVPRVDGREKPDPVTGKRPVRWVAETEALGATNLRAIVRAELDILIPEPLVRVQGRERRQWNALRRLIEG